MLVGSSVEKIQKKQLDDYLLLSFYPCDVVSGVLATATCLAGWVSVTKHLYQNG